MKTRDRIEKLFSNLDIWIKFPKYQAERRLDVFFGLYLTDILKECRNNLFEKEDKLILVPEFPLQKNKNNNECTNIDYLVFNLTKKSVHAIELKTDTHSVDDEQIKYYRKFKNEVELDELFSFATKKRAGRSGQKYNVLATFINENKLNECVLKGNVIYILPNRDFPSYHKIEEEGFDSISFSDIVHGMYSYTSEDELLEVFVKFLQKNEYHK